MVGTDLTDGRNGPGRWVAVTCYQEVVDMSTTALGMIASLDQGGVTVLALVALVAVETVLRRTGFARLDTVDLDLDEG